MTNYTQNNILIKAMRRFSTLLSFLIILLISCNTQDSDLKRNLKLAGTNRVELEKAIKHYSKNKEDSLKLKAVKFLISNMDIHYSYINNTWDSFQVELDSLFQLENTTDDLEAELSKLYDKYGGNLFMDFNYISDLKTISSDFLIDNVESAFINWDNQYCNFLNFEDFCEYILPYRRGNEPLSNWRNIFNTNFIPDIYSRLPNGIDSASAIDFCDAIKSYPYANLSLIAGKLPDYNTQILSIMKIGNCRSYCSQAILAARCLAIPVCVDFTPQWATRSLGHEWNALIQHNKRPLSFGIGDDCELGEHIELIPDRIAPKVYRETFSKQKNSPYMIRNKEEIPPSLTSPNMKDVTDQYYDCVDVSVNFDFKAPNNNKFAYLAVFDNANWIPVCWAKLNGKQAIFKNVNKNILCLPGYYSNNKFIPAASPIIIDSIGNIQEIKLSNTKKQNVVLSRKYQNGLVDGNCEEMIGGRFQVANKPDFSDAVNIYEIIDKPESSYQIIRVSDENEYKYFRYIARPNSLGTIAELEVYEPGSKNKLTGTIIGTEQTLSNFVKENAFDGDPLTNFIRWGSNEVWVGLEFDNPKQIDKIVFLPGNDDNCIRDGELYEFFYWDNKWLSLGKQYGNSDSYKLEYEDVPANALFLLRNHTKGVEERIFTYENGKQIWW